MHGAIRERIILPSNRLKNSFRKHGAPTFWPQITMNRITTDPEICHGKPCIRGLRYPVQTVLEWLAGGMTVAEILDDYPDLESDDIYAALAYAARLAQTNRVELLAA